LIRVFLCFRAEEEADIGNDTLVARLRVHQAGVRKRWDLFFTVLRTLDRTNGASPRAKKSLARRCLPL